MESLVIQRKDLDWKALAECVDTDQDVFFPETKFYENTGQWAELVSLAKSICRECKVREECLEYAMTTGQNDGIWGGLTRNERKRRRKRK